MDTQVYKDRILETENITDALEDPEANWLINWGINQLDHLLDGEENIEAAGERTNHLMAVMRQINRIMGGYSQKDPKDLAESLADLDRLYRETFSINPQVPDDAAVDRYQPAAQHLIELSARPALEFLTSGNLQTVTSAPVSTIQTAGTIGGSGEPADRKSQSQGQSEPKSTESRIKDWIARLFSRSR